MNARTSNVNAILEGLHVNEEEKEGMYRTIAGVRAEVDKNGKIVDEKAKKEIEKRLGKKIDEDDVPEDNKE